MVMEARTDIEGNDDMGYEYYPLRASLNSLPRDHQSQSPQQLQQRKREVSAPIREGHKNDDGGTAAGGSAYYDLHSHAVDGSSVNDATTSRDYPNGPQENLYEAEAPSQSQSQSQSSSQNNNISVIKNLISLAKTDLERRNYPSSQEYLEIAKDVLHKRKENIHTTLVHNGNSRREMDQDIIIDLEEEILGLLVETYLKQGKYGMCYEILKEVESLMGGKKRKLEEVLRFKYDLAKGCLRIGKFEEGVVHATAALMGRKAIFGGKDYRTYESVALMAALLDALGERGMADEYRRSLPPRYSEEFPVLQDDDSPRLLATLTPGSSVSVATIIPSSTINTTEVVEESTGLPTYGQISSTPCLIPGIPPTNPRINTAVAAAQSTLSVASTLCPTIAIDTSDLTLTAFNELCENIDNLRLSGRCNYAGILGTDYLKSVTSSHKWSYWEAWDLIQSHITQYGMNGGPYGRSPLHILTYCSLHDHVKILISRGATVNGKSKGMKTALHIAASVNSRICRLLVDNGAMMDVVDKFGWSALHHAAYHGQLECARVLMENGADLEVLNYRGQTAAMIARSLRKKEIAWLLDPVKGGKKAWYSL